MTQRWRSLIGSFEQSSHLVLRLRVAARQLSPLLRPALACYAHRLVQELITRREVVLDQTDGNPRRLRNVAKAKRIEAIHG